MDYQQALRKVFGFKAFQDGQEEVIKIIMEGKSAIALFSTSVGKSLCYQLPATLLSGMTLVVSPLLSLMKDQNDYLNSLNIPSDILDSTISSSKQRAIMQDIMNNKLKVLFVSPERFKSKVFRHYLSSTMVSLLVIDEAHCISEWGHDFRPSYMKLPDFKKKYGIKQVLLLTATATHPVVQDMATSFKIPKKNIIRVNKSRNNLYLGIKHVSNDKVFDLIDMLHEAPDESTVIYVREKDEAVHLCLLLRNEDFDVDYYHSGMSKDKRDDVQERFFRNELPIVIATKGFGMGLDKRDIRFIYHYNIPSSPEEYVQQTGRAGRDSNPSFCEVLYSTDDVDKMRKILSRGCDENFKMNIRSFVSELKNGGYEINITQSARNLKMTESTIQSILLYLERIGIVNYESVNYRNYEIRILTHKKENLSEDERSFLNYLMASAQTFTGWSSINIYRESENLHKEPSDILRMLNALNDKGIIDLRMQQVLESYTLNKSNFDIDQVAEDIFTIFKERSDQAIKRFNVLESILTSGICIKSQLNQYFGNKTNGHCGSCSVCTVLNPLSRISFQIPLTSLIRYQNLKGQSLLS